MYWRIQGPVWQDYAKSRFVRKWKMHMISVKHRMPNGISEKIPVVRKHYS